MRLILISVALLLTLSVSVYGSSEPVVKQVHVLDVCEGIDDKFISKHIQLPAFEIMGKRKAYSLCEVVLKIHNDYATVYASAEGDFLIVGEMFSSRVHISRESTLKYEKRDILEQKEALDKVVAFTYKPEGNIRDYLYFFTDPQCPHCENAKRRLKEIADNRGLELKVIFFPISSLSRDKAVKGICSKMSYEDYLNSKYAGVSCPEGQKKIEDAVNVGRKLRIGGVPSFITSKGLILEGFNAEGLSTL